MLHLGNGKQWLPTGLGCPEAPPQRSRACGEAHPCPSARSRLGSGRWQCRVSFTPLPAWPPWKNPPGRACHHPPLLVCPDRPCDMQRRGLPPCCLGKPPDSAQPHIRARGSDQTKGFSQKSMSSLGLVRGEVMSSRCCRTVGLAESEMGSWRKKQKKQKSRLGSGGIRRGHSACRGPRKAVGRGGAGGVPTRPTAFQHEEARASLPP